MHFLCHAIPPFPPFLLNNDQNCEHYAGSWVLDCVLHCIVFQMSVLHAAEPPMAEELAAAPINWRLREVGLSEGDEERGRRAAARHLGGRWRRHGPWAATLPTV